MAISPACSRPQAQKTPEKCQYVDGNQDATTNSKIEHAVGVSRDGFAAFTKRAPSIIKQLFSIHHLDHVRIRPWIGAAAAAEPWQSAAHAGFSFTAQSMLQACVSIGCRQGSAAASRLVALLVGTPLQQQHRQWQHWHWRSVWNDSIDQREARKADSFYDSTIERVSACWAAVLCDGLVGGCADSCTRNTHALPPKCCCYWLLSCCSMLSSPLRRCRWSR